jgi:hypothetical protein
LRYDETLGGFPEEPLRQALAGGHLLEKREYFFTHGGVPHLALSLLLDTPRSGSAAGPNYARDREDPGDNLPEHLQPLYQSLRQWRNERAKQVGVPSYVIMRNIQLAKICRTLPRSLAALKQIEGVGEATAAKYGQEILAQIPKDLQPAPPDTPAEASPVASPETPPEPPPAKEPKK